MKLLKQVIGFGLLLSAFVLIFWNRFFEPIPSIVPVQDQVTFPTDTAESTLTPLQTVPLTEEAPPTNTATPAPVQGYVFDQGVDLSSGKPIALILSLPSGFFLPSTWASAVSYRAEDPLDIFEPDKGIVYSYLDQGIPVTWAHSGSSTVNQRLFAYNLDIYLHKGMEGITKSLPEASAMASSLIGSMAILCQDESGEARVLTTFDPALECSGKRVKLQIVAFTIVPAELVPEYDSLSIGIRDWMIANFPAAGFESLSADDSWMIRFCVGRFYDQPEGKSWAPNRGVIAFRVVK